MCLKEKRTDTLYSGQRRTLLNGLPRDHEADSPLRKVIICKTRASTSMSIFRDLYHLFLVKKSHRAGCFLAWFHLTL